MKLTLRDGPSFFFRDEEAPDIFSSEDGPVEGRRLSDEELKPLSRADTRIRAEKTAYDLLARRDHSRRQMEMKLLSRGFSKDAASAACDRIERAGYLSDRLFAEQWVESRLRKRSDSRLALIAGLEKRGVARSLAESVVFAKVDQTREEENLRGEIEKNLRRKAENYFKLSNRLVARGYPRPLVVRILKEYRQDEPE
ncbi:MAG: recombination regulator RecX [Spirochaetales bacterium]|nr:recombination regulator RecX [Spirochaetales bacterium]MCF7938195.1 recombination regulator RecX [Spirochaetales bacterium]